MKPRSRAGVRRSANAQREAIGNMSTTSGFTPPADSPAPLKKPDAEPAPADKEVAPVARSNGAGEFGLKILNGLAIGVVVGLVPSALLGELFKALLPVFPLGSNVIMLTNLSARLLPVLIGATVGILFKLTPIQTLSVAVATLVGSGVWHPLSKGLVLHPGDKPQANSVTNFAFIGTGDIIACGLSAALAVWICLLIADRMKAYTILLVPTIVLMVAGSIGNWVIYPVVSTATAWLGRGIGQLTTLQPIIMGCLMAVIFCCVQLSPMSAVGMALAISLAGVGSGCANLGSCAAGFGLAILAWKVNSVGTSLSHFVGSPKIQMANLVRKPVGFLPILCNAALCGLLGGIFKVQGTPMSAGFGFSGLIGPVNNLNGAAWGWSPMSILLTALLYLVAPVGFGFLFKYVFVDILKMVNPEDYAIKFN